MKMITALIQPFKLDDVVLALEHITAFPGLTVTKCRGFGREKTEPHERSVREAVTDFTAKVRIEIAASDSVAVEIAETIARAAHTGRGGDGKVFVWTLDHAIRITTHEEGEAAL